MASAARVEAHVRELAGAIGERNVFRPQALHAAADYVEQTWRAQGYAVTAQSYDAYGVRCANLEATRPGLSRPQEIAATTSGSWSRWRPWVSTPPTRDRRPTRRCFATSFRTAATFWGWCPT